MLLLSGARARPAAAGPTQGEVNPAIDRAVAALRLAQRPDGSFGGKAQRPNPLGYAAPTVYSLVRAGLPTHGDAIQRAADRMRARPAEQTYDASALLLGLHALDDPSDDDRARAAVTWLVGHFQRQSRLWAYAKRTL